MIREDRKKPRSLPEADFRRMVEALADAELKHRPADWWRVFLHVGYYAGLRFGEMLGLRWADVNDETGELTVRAEVGKGRRERTLPLPAGLPEMLAEWRAASADARKDAHVLPFDRDSTRVLCDDWRVIQAAAGFTEADRYTPHDLRRGCATALIAAGVPTAVD